MQLLGPFAKQLRLKLTEAGEYKVTPPFLGMCEGGGWSGRSHGNVSGSGECDSEWVADISRQGGEVAREKAWVTFATLDWWEIYVKKFVRRARYISNTVMRWKAQH